MTENGTQVAEQTDATTKDSVDRDAILREIVGEAHRPTSPRSLFERANDYVPTRVRPASVLFARHRVASFLG